MPQLATWHCPTATHDQSVRSVVRRGEFLYVAVELGNQHRDHGLHLSSGDAHGPTYRRAEEPSCIRRDVTLISTGHECASHAELA